MSRNFFFLLLFLSLPFSPITQTNTCNFSLHLGEGILANKSYEINFFQLENLSSKRMKRILQLLDLESLATCEMTVAFFEEKLASVCRYKKFELTRVEVTNVEQQIHLILAYKKINHTTKSKL